MTAEGRRIVVRGTVQGVGFRPWVFRLARELGLTGSVHNHTTGVTIEVFGPSEELDAFLARLRPEAPPASVIASVEAEPLVAEHAPREFVITPSDVGAERQLSVPPDLATCADCLGELAEPNDRRHAYAFTNCTNCGPRFTIVRDVPYDRPSTTMAPFVLCPDCRREYEDPADRRFHAEPNACPRCGPRLSLLDAAGGRLEDGDPLVRAADRLLRGEIVAVKGIGGFHLACDATSPEAVRRLRERKHREEKPLALMVRDLEAARRLCHVDDEEARLLAGVERPIVLLRRVEGAAVAPEVVVDASPLLGLFLPYSPLHHLLLAAVGHPLVMTSGNLSDEPLAYRNDEAVERLAGIADAFLVHDRGIETPVDDSVARVIDGQPVVLRRARGWVPRPIRVARPFPEPVLAMGADLKNAFCLAVGDSVYLGPHIGDLESASTYEHLVASVERLERLLRVRPAVVAHDLHPGYFSTEYALGRHGVRRVGVQHHHAHVASCMAEHGLEGPVIGVAFDGTGHGLDGSAWGGELLVADERSFERVATLRPLRLAGGEQAIREPWRVALAALDDAFDGAPPLEGLPLFRRIDPARIDAVLHMLRRGLSAPLAHGCGRWFDAVGALLLGREVSRFEGQVAMALNLIADETERAAYPWALALERDPWQLDLRPTIRAVVEELCAGQPVASISARFHNALIAATAELVRRAAARHGALPVVLSGGSFQNALLSSGLARALSPALSVHRHAQVPPGDGGVALGQALVARASLP